jgi:hypothetical protein
MEMDEEAFDGPNPGDESYPHCTPRIRVVVKAGLALVVIDEADFDPELHALPIAVEMLEDVEACEHCWRPVPPLGPVPLTGQ